MPWSFGDFRLDEERRQLLRGDTPLPVEPKASSFCVFSSSASRVRCPRRKFTVCSGPAPLFRSPPLPVWSPTCEPLSGMTRGDHALSGRSMASVMRFAARLATPGSLQPTSAARSFVPWCCRAPGAQLLFDRPFAALTAALDEPDGAAVHVCEFALGSGLPSFFSSSSCSPSRRRCSCRVLRSTSHVRPPTGGPRTWSGWHMGPYLFDGMREPVEKCTRLAGQPVSLLKPPPDSNGARRALRPGDEATLGWRPAPGLAVPAREGWACLQDKLGEGGFGEVWLAGHPSGERRVFKFCFDATRLRGLKREATLFRLLKEELGERDDIARVLDWNFDEPPYFLESEYTEGGSLVDWGKAAGGIATVPLETRLLLDRAGRGGVGGRPFRRRPSQRR